MVITKTSLHISKSSRGKRWLQKCLDEEKEALSSRQPRNSEAILIEVDPKRKEISFITKLFIS